MSENETHDRNSIRFIRDTAADADFFEGSHQRVADAIAVTVQESDAKTIGLIGRWGSGKSTVIKLVEKALAEAQANKFHLFTYDAWIHQSDPPRRAFLEQLIAFLSKQGFGDKQLWKDELDALQRKKDETDTTTTPILTTAGRFLLVPLFLLPIAFVFSGRPWYEAWSKAGSRGWDYWPFTLALVIIGAPLAVALLLYLWLRPTWKFYAWDFWKRWNWTTHRRPYQDESILALISNRHVTRQRTSALKAVEPTAIEFQCMFRRILGSVSKKNERLVIVVDNLDRLDRDEAIAMWTTIRSFFLGAIGEEENLKRSDLPTVILPVDASAIRRAQNANSSDNPDNLGRSFMDKSFDVIFYVAPPVLSNWQSFLRKQMSEAFGSELEGSWVHETIRIYRHRADSGEPVTPRDVNRAVNAIAALWLQWRTMEIPFISVAYYAIYKQVIDENLVQALNNPVVDISDEDPQWATSIAALHYGVSATVATQVLLDGPLRRAIDSGNKHTFNSHSKFNGFGTAIERLLDDRSYMDGQRQASLNSLLAQLPASTEPWLTFAWRRLAQLYPQTDIWNDFGAQAPRCASELVTHVSGEKRRRLLGSLAATISRWPLPNYAEKGFLPMAAELLNVVANAAATDGLNLKVSLKAKDEQFLELAALVYGDEPTLTLLLVERDTKHLAGLLASQLATGGKLLEEKAHIVLRTRPDDWKTLIDASSAALQSGPPDGKAAATIILGGLSSEVQPADDAVRTNAQNGHLQALINATLFQNHANVAARALTLLLLADHPVSPPDGQNWQYVVDTVPELPGMVDSLLRQWHKPSFYPLLVSALKRDNSMLPLIRPLMTSAIQRAELGELPFDAIIASPSDYTRGLETGDALGFVEQLARQEKFWAALDAAGLNVGAVELMQELSDSRESEARRTARKTLREKLKGLSADRWLTTVRDGGVILQAAKKLQGGSERTIAIGQPLFDALTQLTPELIANEQRPYASRWFDAANLLSASHKRTLLRNLRDQLFNISPPPRLQDLLAAGGETLLTDGEFDAKSDECIRLLVLPLVRNGGLAWLVSQSSTISRWFQKSKADTKTVARESIEEALNGLSDDDKSRAGLLLQAFGGPQD